MPGASRLQNAMSRSLGFDPAVVEVSPVSHTKPIRVYTSAVDLWLFALLIAGPIFVVALGIYALAQGQAQEALVCAFIAAGNILLTSVFTIPCRYTLTVDTLHLRCGLITETIPLDRVCNVHLSRSWRSGLSLSLKRVCVQLDHGARYISPRDREQFMTDLMEAVAAVKGKPIEQADQ